jgi:hypothetical protein
MRSQSAHNRLFARQTTPPGSVPVNVEQPLPQRTSWWSRAVQCLGLLFVLFCLFGLPWVRR